MLDTSIFFLGIWLGGLRYVGLDLDNVRRVGQ